jgi:hypothetical protein
MGVNGRLRLSTGLGVLLSAALVPAQALAWPYASPVTTPVTTPATTPAPVTVTPAPTAAPTPTPAPATPTATPAPPTTPTIAPTVTTPAATPVVVQDPAQSATTTTPIAPRPSAADTRTPRPTDAQDAEYEAQRIAEEKEGRSKEVDGDPGEFGIPAKIVFHGAMEAYYAYNFNNPSNDITNWRWYDHRHNQLGLQGLWFVPEWEVGPVKGHFQLQLGVLSELFWYSERSLEEDMLWRLLQEATMEWTTPWKRLSIEGGIFNVPFGPEWNLAFRNWNWSTGNLFALMPYQITGFRANFDVGKGFIARVGIYNGWDRIVKDNNRQKAMMASLEWTDPNDEENYFVFNYMIGNERSDGHLVPANIDPAAAEELPDALDPRGKTPRHTFDLYGQWHIVEKFTMRLWTFSGFEYQKYTKSMDGWLGLSAFAKVDPTSWFSVAARGDFVYVRADSENLFHTDVLEDPVTSTKLGSGTLTLSFQPHSNVILRIEARHDRASFPLFFKGNVQLYDPMDPRSFLTNAKNQTTLMAGMTTFF